MSNHPIAASGPREPAIRPKPIPKAIRRAVELMVWGEADDIDGKPLDLVAAAKAANVQGFILRRYLDRPAVIAYLRAQRRACLAAVSAGNPMVLADIRNNAENQMARVAAARAIEGIEDNEGGRAAATDTPGIVIRIINSIAAPTGQPMVDVTPAPATRIEPPEPPDEPPLAPAGFRWPR
jgi:hypothetical protein